MKNYEKEAKIYTKHGDVRVAFPSVLKEEAIADLLDTFTPATPLSKVTAALGRMGAKWATWRDGTPGHSDLFGQPHAGSQNQVREEVARRNQQMKTSGVKRFERRMADATKWSRGTSKLEVAVAAGGEAEDALALCEWDSRATRKELGEELKQQRKIARRGNAIGAAGAVVGIGACALAVAIAMRK